MFETKHKDHKIEKLENIYNSHCVLIKNESKELKNKSDKLNNYLKLLNEKIIFVRNYKTERSIELEDVFEKMKNKLEGLMHEKLTKLINSKNMIIDKLKFLDNIKTMIESELNEAPKSELISKSENIINDLKEIEKEDEMKNDVLNISLNLPSDIHPPYESGCFLVKDYKQMVIRFQNALLLQQKNSDAGCNNIDNFNGFGSNEVLYSEDLKTNGLTWRLKVYPFGNGSIKGEFISVFLELRDGLLETSKYFYKIEIENFYSK
jgi:tripartite motif-containing protein 37